MSTEVMIEVLRLLQIVVACATVLALIWAYWFFFVRPYHRAKHVAQKVATATWDGTQKASNHVWNRLPSRQAVEQVSGKLLSVVPKPTSIWPFNTKKD
jgi:hypothetical protein